MDKIDVLMMLSAHGEEDMYNWANENLHEKNDADKKRMDWLESSGGMIGIDHIGYGDYRHYAGEMFKPLRDVVDAAMTHNAQVNPAGEASPVSEANEG